MARRFVPKVHLAHDDHDAKSRMSDTPLQLPASAKCSVEHFRIGNVLTGWEPLPCTVSTASNRSKIRPELNPFA